MGKQEEEDENDAVSY